MEGGEDFLAEEVFICFAFYNISYTSFSSFNFMLWIDGSYGFSYAKIRFLLQIRR